MREIERPWPNAYVVPGTTLIAGEYPGTYPERTHPTTEEKLGALLDAGVTTVVDLTEAGTMVPYEATLRRIAQERGVTVAVHRLPIVDMDVCDAARMGRILDTVDTALGAGEVVYVHCWGGVGRTGTVVGCHLVRHGASGDDALRQVEGLFATMSPEKVRRHPEGSPQTRAQREMVRRWARHDATLVERSWLLDRVRGCLLGGAVGDALGWPVEFLSLAEIRRRFGPDGIRDFAPADGGIGAVTDDTQMTLFTAEGLLVHHARRACDEESDVASAAWQAYQRWYATQRGSGDAPDDVRGGWLLDVAALHASRAPGNTCMGSLRGGRMGSVRAPINASKGCGGVMRAAPVGVVSGSPFVDGMTTAALTHGHPSGYLPAGALALMIALLLDGATIEHAAHVAIDRVEREPGHEETSRALRAALDLARGGDAPTPELIERLGQGWTGEEALAIALYCALVAGDDFAAGVRLAVNHSGDSDSTGAIAGNLLGAALGGTAIPAEWRERVELRDVIGTIADDLVMCRRSEGVWRARYHVNHEPGIANEATG